MLDHELTIDADMYMPTDDTLIPTGKIAPVKGTPMDFNKPTRIGTASRDSSRTGTMGYDHYFVLQAEQGTDFAAKLKDPTSGRVLTVSTTQPALQFYTGNNLNGQKGKGGKTYKIRSAVCLETAHFPDSVNHPAFPSIILRPGQTYQHTCIYALSVE